MTMKNKIVMPADFTNLSPGITPIVELLEQLEVDHKTIYKVELCLEELLANVASYAYPPDVEGDIEIHYEVVEDPRMIEITIIDKGRFFNPLETKDPDTTLSAEERNIGGLGVFIVKNTMDFIEYHRKDDKNILIIKKKI